MTDLACPVLAPRFELRSGDSPGIADAERDASVRFLAFAFTPGDTGFVFPDSLLSSAQAAEILAVTPSHLRQMRHMGRGPAYIKEGKLVRYEPAALAAWIESRRIS
ncbi:MAG: helix-turn-helix domain-containing protein [Nocardiaceae bacterium]|nr:helix-turn-helix domain-containing protein [Nocardiaceae bacterium]